MVAIRKKGKAENKNNTAAATTSVATGVGRQLNVNITAQARNAVVVEAFLGVSQFACLMRQHWFAASVFLDAINKHRQPEKLVTQQEMLRILEKHPPFLPQIYLESNNIGMVHECCFGDIEKGEE